uniref:uncharacterized protein LOC114598141 n=1 Tax=Podarcis muralis TaxID=64176 RepID=UPI00109F80BF|nr:uncharacterized protein LOC114598141 [Podarcis muralis]
MASGEKLFLAPFLHVTFTHTQQKCLYESVYTCRFARLSYCVYKHDDRTLTECLHEGEPEKEAGAERAAKGRAVVYRVLKPAKSLRGKEPRFPPRPSPPLASSRFVALSAQLPARGTLPLGRPRRSSSRRWIRCPVPSSQGEGGWVGEKLASLSPLLASSSGGGFDFKNTQDTHTHTHILAEVLKCLARCLRRSSRAHLEIRDGDQLARGRNFESPLMYEVSEHQSSGTDSSGSSLGSSVTACKKVLCSNSLLESTDYWSRIRGHHAGLASWRTSWRRTMPL